MRPTLATSLALALTALALADNKTPAGMAIAAGYDATYWSGSTYAEDVSFAWDWIGYNGQTHMKLKTDSSVFVRCVRDLGATPGVDTSPVMLLLQDGQEDAAR